MRLTTIIQVVAGTVLLVGSLVISSTFSRIGKGFAVLNSSASQQFYRQESVLEMHYHQSLPGRLAEAVFIATELRRSNSYLQLMCPSEQAIGGRPQAHTARLIGTTCEAWANREWIELFWHVVDRNMIALEWSTGSGSLWILRRGLTLHSIEHCGEWLDDVKKHVDTNFPHLKDRWFPHHVLTSHGCRQDGSTDEWEIKEQIFGEYARFPRNHLTSATPTGYWDVINIDGRFRDGCMLEALDLVKPEYGMVVLDNAERTFYRKSSEIPSHWLVISFRSKVSETALWMSCPTVADAHCLRARQEIASMMNNLPQEAVGGRYTAHMERAKLDGVPGA